VLVVYASVPLLLGLMMMADRAVRRRPSGWGYLVTLALYAAMSTLGAAGGHGLRMVRMRKVCRSVEPLLLQVEAHRAEHGKHPSRLADVEGFVSAMNQAGLRVAQGNWSPDGLGLSGISHVDALIYLGEEEVACLVPVTKPLPLSFTRFYAYGWSSHRPSWEVERHVWWLGAIGEPARWPVMADPRDGSPNSPSPPRADMIPDAFP